MTLSVHQLPESRLIHQVRRAITHEYRYGQYPAALPPEVAAYLAEDGGLLKALTDLEWALIELETRRRSGRLRY